MTDELFVRLCSRPSTYLQVHQGHQGKRFMSENKKFSWTALENEQVFTCPVFNVKREKSCCGRTAVTHNFYTIGFANWVNVIAVTESDELVMIKQFRHGTGRVELEVPGGCIDKSDTDPLTAGARELFEETGFTADLSKGEIIGHVSPNPALQGNICYTAFFRDVVHSGTHAMEDTEDIEYLTVPVNELEKMIVSGMISHGLVLNAIQFFILKSKKEIC